MNTNTEINIPACASGTPSLMQLASAFSRHCLENNVIASVDMSDIIFEPAADGTYIVKSTVNVKTDCLSSCKASFTGFVKSGDSEAANNIICNALSTALSFTGFNVSSAVSMCKGTSANNTQEEPPISEETPCLSVSDEEANNEPKSDTETVPEIQPVTKYVPINPELSGPMTLKDAYCFKIPLGSPQQGKGRTISEVMGMNPGLISWYASDAFNPDRGSKEAIKERRLLKQACAMVTEAAAE